MFKKLITIIAIALIAITGYWIYQSTTSEGPGESVTGKQCEVDSSCFVFGKDGDCNCGCFDKDYEWLSEGECFCAAPTSCKCLNGKCEGVFEEK